MIVSLVEGNEMSITVTANSEPKLGVLQGRSGAYRSGVTNAIKPLRLSPRRMGHIVTLFTDEGDLDRRKVNHIGCYVTDPGPRSKVPLQS